MVLAPFVPFLAEELFLNLTGGEAGESVHLLDWPKSGKVDETVLREMAEIRLGIEQGLSQRAAHKLKVRQPLAEAHVYMSKLPESSETAWHYAQIVKEELNVKYADLGEILTEGMEGTLYETVMDFELTPELKREGVMRELVRQVQEARKKAGLQVDDRIRLVLETTDDEVKQAIAEHAETIKTETLAVSLNEGTGSGYKAEVKVEDASLTISLEKAGE
jgi:isoleucyl-tRNA synthetase